MANTKSALDPAIQEYRKIVGRFIMASGYSREEAIRCIDAVADQSAGYLQTVANSIARNPQNQANSVHIKNFIENGWLPSRPASAKQDRQSAQVVNMKPQGGGNQSPRQPAANEDVQENRRFDQVKIFGRKAAITVHAIWSKNNPNLCEGMMFDFAEVDMSKPKRNGMHQFAWDRKVMFSATETECVAICLTLLGRIPKLHGLVQTKLRDGQYGYDEGIYHQNGPFKKLNAELQQGGTVYMSIATNQDAQQNQTRLIGVPIGHGDRIKLAGFILSRLRMSDVFRGMSASDILSVGSTVLRQ